MNKAIYLLYKQVKKEDYRKTIAAIFTI